jgi:hypothetical protein
MLKDVLASPHHCISTGIDGARGISLGRCLKRNSTHERSACTAGGTRSTDQGEVKLAAKLEMLRVEHGCG